VAEAWFGQIVDRATAEHFARVLESVGLVRRDDHRRDRLWVLSPGETDLFPGEAALEEQLKRANPKGRLLELCMRMRIEAPQTDVQQQGAFYVASMSLCHEGRALASGPCKAPSKKTAEQQAAQALLDMVLGIADESDVVIVTADQTADLQSENPKGKLIEWCAKIKCEPPHYEQDAYSEGYRVRGTLSLGGEDNIVTRWYGATKSKTAEQAAARAILDLVPGRSSAERDDSTTATQPRPLDGRNPMMVLNELTQAGVLQEVDYEVVDCSGPSHQPTFAVVARATAGDGQTWRTEPVDAPSKKTGQRAAAGRLLDLLAADGVTRR
jgi:dsRNA-specific ribonuclease